MKLGFVGLGKMGLPMAERLLAGGYQVTGYLRDRGKRESFIERGGRAVETLTELPGAAEIIFTCLAMPSDVEEVYLGPRGLLADPPGGLLCVDFTTLAPEFSCRMAARAEAKEVFYLDAPVSGGPEGAAAGTLTIMVGGAGDAFTRVEGLLRVLGAKVEHLGPSGLGSAAKLLNQYLVGVHTAATAEVAAAAEKLGIAADKLYDLIRASYGQSRMFERHLKNHIIPGSFEPGGAVKYVLKDLGLVNPLFEAQGVPPTTGLAAREVFTRAAEAGLSERDMSSLYLLLKKG